MRLGGRGRPVSAGLHRYGTSSTDEDKDAPQPGSRGFQSIGVEASADDNMILHRVQLLNIQQSLGRGELVNEGMACRVRPQGKPRGGRVEMSQLRVLPLNLGQVFHLA